MLDPASPQDRPHIVFLTRVTKMLIAGWVPAWRNAGQSWPRKLRADTWHGVHSSTVGAADCRAAGPWSKSGCALFVISWHCSCNCAPSTKDKTSIVQPLPSTSPNQVCRTFPPIPKNLPEPFNTFADHFPQDLPAIFVAFACVPFPLLAFARILSVQFCYMGGTWSRNKLVGTVATCCFLEGTRIKHDVIPPKPT